MKKIALHFSPVSCRVWGSVPGVRDPDFKSGQRCDGESFHCPVGDSPCRPTVFEFGEIHVVENASLNIALNSKDLNWAEWFAC